MKKLIVFIVCVITVTGLGFLISTTDVVYNVMGDLVNETDPTTIISDKAWYYTTLNADETDIYQRIITAVSELEESVIFVTNNKINDNSIKKAFEAFTMDNAQIFYLTNKYTINEKKYAGAYKYEIKLNYTVENKQELVETELQIENEINKIIDKVITDDMTDFEKELAIHDYLVTDIRYYDYDLITKIPQEKHNIDGALLGKVAVCDGYAKAFKVILERLNIDVVTVSGEADGVPHAWSKVKLDDKWYNVDVTSDSITKERIPTHVYFNVTDEEISQTHTLDNTFVTPSCTAEKYNYYKYYDYEIGEMDYLSFKLSLIISRNNSKALEFKVLDDSYTRQDIVNELYDLNFNNYKENNVSNVEYYVQNNKYLLINNER